MFYIFEFNPNLKSYYFIVVDANKDHDHILKFKFIFILYKELTYLRFLKFRSIKTIIG